MATVRQATEGCPPAGQLPKKFAGDPEKEATLLQIPRFCTLDVLAAEGLALHLDTVLLELDPRVRRHSDFEVLKAFACAYAHFCDNELAIHCHTAPGLSWLVDALVDALWTCACARRKESCCWGRWRCCRSAPRCAAWPPSTSEDAESFRNLHPLGSPRTSAPLDTMVDTSDRTGPTSHTGTCSLCTSCPPRTLRGQTVRTSMWSEAWMRRWFLGQGGC
ncbi:uncharacterized protein PS065_022418 [Dugong dugon]